MMKTLWMSVVIGAALGCAHVREPGSSTGEEKDKAAEQKKPDSKAGATAGQGEKAPDNTKSSAPSAAKEQTRPSAGAGRPELSSSPAGMMTPEGPKLIQDALIKKGYLSGPGNGELDDATSGALMRFQADHHIAKTGVPDHETVSLLGLTMSKVFRTARGGDQPPDKHAAD